jgi:hypothetical protein
MLPAVILGLILGAVLLRPFFRRLGAHDAQRQLERRCLGDVNRAQRLIDHEMRRRPGISRTEAITRALDALSRDNR